MLEIGMYILLSILAFLEGVVAIIGSAISCCGVCCNSKVSIIVTVYTFDHSLMFYNVHYT